MIRRLEGPITRSYNYCGILCVNAVPSEMVDSSDMSRETP
jgi:hypothetical protein